MRPPPSPFRKIRKSQPKERVHEFSLHFIDKDPAKAAINLPDAYLYAEIEQLSRVLVVASHIHNPITENLGRAIKRNEIRDPVTQWVAASMKIAAWVHEYSETLLLQHFLRTKNLHPRRDLIEYIRQRNTYNQKKGSKIPEPPPPHPMCPKKFIILGEHTSESHRKFLMHTAENPQWTSPGERPSWWV